MVTSKTKSQVDVVLEVLREVGNPVGTTQFKAEMAGRLNTTIGSIGSAISRLVAKGLAVHPEDGIVKATTEEERRVILLRREEMQERDALDLRIKRVTDEDRRRATIPKVLEIIELLKLLVASQDLEESIAAEVRNRSNMMILELLHEIERMLPQSGGNQIAFAELRREYLANNAGMATPMVLSNKNEEGE